MTSMTMMSMMTMMTMMMPYDNHGHTQYNIAQKGVLRQTICRSIVSSPQALT